MQKCVAYTAGGNPCPNSAKYSDPAALPGGPLVLCGTHLKNAKKHMDKHRFDLLLPKMFAPVPVAVPATKTKTVVAVAPKKKVTAVKDDDDDEMTDEEVRLHRSSSSPTLAKKASKDTVDNGISVERLVDIVKIDNKFYVCNVTGSSEDKADWKPFWEKRIKKAQPRLCQIKDCVREVGATGHMYWRDDKDKNTYNYLIPICSHHNGSKNGYEWEGDATNWQPCKAGLAVKIKESPKTTTHAYNLRARKPAKK
jgi:hypothetical protein